MSARAIEWAMGRGLRLGNRGLILFELARRADAGGDVGPARIEDLAAGAKLSTRTAQRAIRELEHLQLLEVTVTRGEASRYRLRMEPAQHAIGAGEDGPP